MAKNQATTFSNLPKDGSKIAIQASRAFQTTDITGTPKTSPLTVSSSVVTVLIPDAAVRMVLYSTANDVRISELVAGTPYFLLKVSTLLTIDVAQMSAIYFLRDAGSDVTLQFYFQTV